MPFEVIDPTNDFKVIVDGTEITYDATPADATEYSFSGTLKDGGYEGGTINLGATVINVDVNIILEMPFTRSTDFTYPSQTINIKTLNTDLDSMVLMLKQLRSLMNRSLRQPGHGIRQISGGCRPKRRAPASSWASMPMAIRWSRTALAALPSPQP